MRKILLLAVLLSGCGPVLLKDRPEYKQAVEVVDYCKAHGYPMRVVKSDIWGTPQLWDQDDAANCKLGSSLDQRCSAQGFERGSPIFNQCREALYRQHLDRTLMATSALPLTPLPRSSQCYVMAGTLRCTEQ